ncbi:MAG: alpha-keto acid decarboxylase family protein [Hyphomicrobiales bacterium]
MKITVGDYLLKRLKEVGVDHIFGVPGDYNLGFLDQIVNYKDLKWIGNCNELNGAYAADGYARVKGVSAMVTTFGVGELSAINGIAGAYAEQVPLIKIVGMPSTSVQNNKSIVHHTLGNSDFTVFSDMYSHLTVAQTIINPFNASREIDRLITCCLTQKRPVYIGLPTDISYQEIEDNTETLNFERTPSNPDAIQEATSRVSRMIQKSTKPIILADIGALRHPEMRKTLINLSNRTGIPTASLPMGKGVIDESSSLFLGIYNGELSDKYVQERVESSDLVISFGTVLSDFNTGGFSSQINVDSTIDIQYEHVKIKHSLYTEVHFEDFIPALTESLDGYQHQENIQNKSLTENSVTDSPLTQEALWFRSQFFFKENSNIIADIGTSSFGLINQRIPNNTNFVHQSLWGSIGFSVGALLGTCLADKTKENICFVGDGSFQLTAQEISTMVRHKLTPIIFLVNNQGYTVERAIHGANMEYNDIQPWDYKELPKIFGDHVWSTKVCTLRDLETALSECDTNKDKLRFIELTLDKDDVPSVLKDIACKAASLNKY